jgi:Coenzyme PQQ synthesis protein D (PqqD)
MKTSYIAKSPMAASRQLGGEVIIMSAIDSTLFTLNEVASVIWKCADGATPLHEIVETKICAEFDVDFTMAFADAERLVFELAEQRVLLLSEQPLNPPHSQFPTREQNS